MDYKTIIFNIFNHYKKINIDSKHFYLSDNRVCTANLERLQYSGYLNKK